MRLRAIRKIRMPQRIRCGDAAGWIEAQHSGDQVQQRVAEQPGPRVLTEMGDQAVLEGRGRHEVRSNVVGGVAVGAAAVSKGRTRYEPHAAAVQSPVVTHRAQVLLRRSSKHLPTMSGARAQASQLTNK